MGYLPNRLLLEVPTCPLCEEPLQACRGHTEDPEHLITYPWLPGGKDPMAEGVYTIKETDGDGGRVWDPRNGLLVGSAGHRIPLSRAVELGLTDPKPPKEPAPVAKVRKTTRTRPKARGDEVR